MADRDHKPNETSDPPQTSEDDLFDICVVGGGAAGMAALWELRDRRVVLLKAGNRLGGRTRSEDRGAYWINLGAISCRRRGLRPRPDDGCACCAAASGARRDICRCL